MSKKSSGLFIGTKGHNSEPSEKINVNAMDFNSAGSKDVKTVEKANVIGDDNHIGAPIKSIPNSVTKIVFNGKLIRERFYDGNGNVYLDIDYTNHGNAATHPIVPHQHKWHKNEDGHFTHEKGERIK